MFHVFHVRFEHLGAQISSGKCHKTCKNSLKIHQHPAQISKISAPPELKQGGFKLLRGVQVIWNRTDFIFFWKVFSFFSKNSRNFVKSKKWNCLKRPKMQKQLWDFLEWKFLKPLDRVEIFPAWIKKNYSLLGGGLTCSFGTLLSECGNQWNNHTSKLCPCG